METRKRASLLGAQIMTDEHDRNKTTITERVTGAAAEWLSGIGAKPVETEVHIRQGWTADLAAIWSPTRTEAANQKIIPRTPPYTGITTKAQRAQRSEILRYRDELWEQIPSPMTIVGEVKTSNADFLRETKWIKESPADMRILFVTKDVFESNEMPAGWWAAIHDSETGAFVRVKTRAPFTPVDDRQRFLIAWQIAERRHHRTEQRWINDVMKKQRAAQLPKRCETRLFKLAQLVLDIVEGKYKSVDEAIIMNAIRYEGKLPDHIMARLNRLDDIAKGRFK